MRPSCAACRTTSPLYPRASTRTATPAIASSRREPITALSPADLVRIFFTSSRARFSRRRPRRCLRPAYPSGLTPYGPAAVARPATSTTTTIGT
jgi:hypothetical protein